MRCCSSRSAVYGILQLLSEHAAGQPGLLQSPGLFPRFPLGFYIAELRRSMSVARLTSQLHVLYAHGLVALAAWRYVGDAPYI
jgi:hypothetical protein